jgi:Ca-activated chloride channel family protein
VSGPLLQHPEWLAPAAGVVLAAGAALLAAALRARRRRSALLGRRAPTPGARRDLLLLGALAALAAAGVGPRIGEREIGAPSGGADVVLLLDVSWSMTASDTPPGRLQRAQRAATAVLARLAPGDRAALAAFAGHGVLLAPLTSDAAALGEMLPLVDASLIGAGGSDVGDGIRRALEAFADAPPRRPRAILLLSDGEDPARRGAGEAAALAARAGVRIVTAAFGSDAGAVLEDLPPSAARRGPVVSRRDTAALGALARATGGAAFEADAWGELDADALAAALLPARRGAVARGAEIAQRVPAVRVAPFAALAFALLALEWVGARGRLRRGAGALAVAAAAAGAVGAGPGDAPLPPAPAPAALEAHLRRHPGDPEALVWLGLARAERGELAEAERAFAAAALLAPDPALAALAFDDLGVTALAQGRLERARDAFFAAVALDPTRRRAIYNLEWTLAALAARPPEPEGGGERGEEAGPNEPETPRDRDPTPENDAPQAGADARGEPREGADAARAPDAGAAPELSESEARRWLEATPDDAARALRGAAAKAGDGRPRRAGPGW